MVEPCGKSGGMLVGWQEDVVILQIRKNDYYLEVELEETDTKKKMWAIFVHASIEERVRRNLWEELVGKREKWGKIGC